MDRSPDALLQVLDRLPIVAGYRLLRQGDLQGYDPWSFPGVFHARGAKVVTLNQLRHALRDRSGDGSYHVEQLESLLQRESMTHASLIRESPLALLVVAIPSAGLEQAAIAQLELIRTVAEVIERGRPGD